MTRTVFALVALMLLAMSYGQSDDRDPYLGINYIICLDGSYPSRSGDKPNTEPMIGEVRMFAGNYAPSGWAFCDGKLITIEEHQTLFSVIGTLYGGDGRVTLALPDLRGRTPVQQGTASEMAPIKLGEKGGS